MSGITYRSVKGSKLTSNEVDSNFAYLDQEGNKIVTDAGFSVVGQDVTMMSGYEWKIMGVDYTNATNVTINIPYATSGNQRIDLIVANASNTFERIPGVESASNPALPSTQGKVVVTIIDVTDGSVGGGSTTIVGADYVKKSFSQPTTFNGTGADQVIPLDPLGREEIRLTGSGLVSISGFDLSLITGNPSAEVPYISKPYRIVNLTGGDVALKNSDGTADIIFLAREGADVVIPNLHELEIKFGGGGMGEGLKSWSSGGSVNINKGNFNGEFDFSNGKNNFYNDYLYGSVVSLSMSSLKELGTICKVRIKGDLLNSFYPVDWIFRGDALSNSSDELNDIVILYVNDNEIILVNNIVSYALQQYPPNFSLESAWHKFDIATTNDVGGFVTQSTDSLTTTPYNLSAIGNVVRSVQNSKECVYLNSSYLSFGTSLNSVFTDSFSISMKIKLIDGQPVVTNYLASLRAIVSSSSRFFVDIRTDGKVTVCYSANSVSVFAQTNAGVFANGAMADFNHLVITVTKSGFIKIFYNKVEQALNPSFNGDMSPVNMALFSSADFLKIGYDTPAAVYTNTYIKDFVIQPIVYDAGAISNLYNMP